MDFEEFIKQHSGMMLISDRYDIPVEDMVKIMTKALAFEVSKTLDERFEETERSNEKLYNRHHPAMFRNTRSG